MVGNVAVKESQTSIGTSPVILFESNRIVFNRTSEAKVVGICPLRLFDCNSSVPVLD